MAKTVSSPMPNSLCLPVEVLELVVVKALVDLEDHDAVEFAVHTLAVVNHQVQTLVFRRVAALLTPGLLATFKFADTPSEYLRHMSTGNDEASSGGNNREGNGDDGDDDDDDDGDDDYDDDDDDDNSSGVSESDASTMELSLADLGERDDAIWMHTSVRVSNLTPQHCVPHPWFWANRDFIAEVAKEMAAFARTTDRHSPQSLAAGCEIFARPRMTRGSLVELWWIFPLGDAPCNARGVSQGNTLVLDLRRWRGGRRDRARTANVDLDSEANATMELAKDPNNDITRVVIAAQSFCVAVDGLRRVSFSATLTHAHIFLKRHPVCRCCVGPRDCIEPAGMDPDILSTLYNAVPTAQVELLTISYADTKDNPYGYRMPGYQRAKCAVFRALRPKVRFYLQGFLDTFAGDPRDRAPRPAPKAYWWCARQVAHRYEESARSDAQKVESRGDQARQPEEEI